jgi:hypothetical protein
VLNIQDPEARRLAKELAEFEGVSLTALVVSARELGLTPDSDPIAEIYDPQTGLPA